MHLSLYFCFCHFPICIKSGSIKITIRILLVRLETEMHMADKIIIFTKTDWDGLMTSRVQIISTDGKQLVKNIIVMNS